MKPPKSCSSRRTTQSPAPSSASLKRKRNDVSLTPLGQSTSQQATRRTSTQPVDKLSSRDSNESDADSVVSGERSRARKGKSSLRPKPIKYVHNKHLDKGLVDVNDADDDETDEAHGEVQATQSSKRKMLDDLRSRRAKRRHSEKPPSETELVAIGGLSTIMQDDQDEESIEIYTDIYHDADESKILFKQPILPFRFSSRNGEDEGDVWRCSTDGCMHRVYAASESSSQDLINDHQRLHEFDGDTRVQLVRKMEAPWLPVGRLMGRVRDLAAQGGGPAPIVQRY